MAKMFLMCGNIAVGKSYVAKKIAGKLGCRYLNIDDCYAILNGDERIHENKFEVWQLFYRLIHKCIELNQDVVVDTNAPFINDRLEFLNWFPDFKEHHLIWVHAEDELALKANEERGRTVPENTVISLRYSFQPPEFDEPAGRSEWDTITRIRNNFTDEFEIRNIRGVNLDVRKAF